MELLDGGVRDVNWNLVFGFRLLVWCLAFGLGLVVVPFHLVYSWSESYGVSATVVARGPIAGIQSCVIFFVLFRVV